MEVFKSHTRTNLVFSLLLVLALSLASPSLSQFFSPATNQQLPAVPPPTANDDLVPVVVGSPPPPPLAPPGLTAGNNLPFGKPLGNGPNYPQQQQGLANQPMVGPAQPLVGLNQPFSTMDNPSLGSSSQMGLPGNLPFENWAPVERMSVVVVTLVCLVAFTASL